MKGVYIIGDQRREKWVNLLSCRLLIGFTLNIPKEENIEAHKCFTSGFLLPSEEEYFANPACDNDSYILPLINLIPSLKLPELSIKRLNCCCTLFIALWCLFSNSTLSNLNWSYICLSITSMYWLRVSMLLWAFLVLFYSSIMSSCSFFKNKLISLLISSRESLMGSNLWVRCLLYV